MGFPCTIHPVDPVDYARAHGRDSVYGVRFSSLSRSIPGYILIVASIPIPGRANSISTYDQQTHTKIQQYTLTFTDIFHYPIIIWVTHRTELFECQKFFNKIKSYKIVFVRKAVVIEVLKQVNEQTPPMPSERREPVRAYWYRSRLQKILDVMAVDQDGLFKKSKQLA